MESDEKIAKMKHLLSTELTVEAMGKTFLNLSWIFGAGWDYDGKINIFK